jgi:hypothetical protein
MLAKEFGDWEWEWEYALLDDYDSESSIYCSLVLSLALRSFLFLLLNCLISFHSP